MMLLRYRPFTGVALVLFLVSSFVPMNQISYLSSQDSSATSVVPKDSFASSEDVVLGPMRSNVIPNSGFEEVDSMGLPLDYRVAATTFTDFSTNYTATVANGTYAAYFAARGTNITGGLNHLYYVDHLSPYANLTQGITLELYWNVLANPDLSIGSHCYLELLASDEDTVYSLTYYFSHAPWQQTTNYTNSGSFSLNDTIGEWHQFRRNLTEDFLNTPVFPALTPNIKVSTIYFEIRTPVLETATTEVVVDTIRFSNGTFDDYLGGSGDFETQDYLWNAFRSSSGYITQSPVCTEGAYSANLTLASDGAGGNAMLSYQYDYPLGLYAQSPGSLEVGFDWKYNENPSFDVSQVGYLQVVARGPKGSHYFYFVLDMGSRVLSFTNTTIVTFYALDGIGVRDSWHRAAIDLCRCFADRGLVNVTAVLFTFDITGAEDGTGVELLIDDLQVVTYPLGDPGFEVDWYQSSYTPFAAWDALYGGAGVIHRTSDAHSGNYACNLTPFDNLNAAVVRWTSVRISPDVFTDFWWRLDDMTDGGSFAYLYLRFEGGYTLNYVLGTGGEVAWTNSTGYTYMFVDHFNQTGSWNNLVRNVTADAEEVFNITQSWVLTQVALLSHAGSEERVSIIFDDMHLRDVGPPDIESVTRATAVPVYYEPVEIRAAVKDSVGIFGVSVCYSTGAIWSVVEATESIGYYYALIPQQPFGSLVDYYVNATDWSGNTDFDDNAGLNYSYVVQDDLGPSLTITSPGSGANVEGAVLVEADAADPGAGMDRVEFFVDSLLVSSATDAPYEYLWDTDVESLGLHTIEVYAYDNGGASSLELVTVTVVDTTTPMVSQPDDVVMDEGVLGMSVSWTASDLRPWEYIIYIGGGITRARPWNSSGEMITLSLDGLSSGLHNVTLTVIDEGGNVGYSAVWVTVNPTGTGVTTTAISTTTQPTGSGFPTSPLFMAVVAGLVGLVIVVSIVLLRRKSR